MVSFLGLGRFHMCGPVHVLVTQESGRHFGEVSSACGLELPVFGLALPSELVECPRCAAELARLRETDMSTMSLELPEHPWECCGANVH